RHTPRGAKQVALPGPTEPARALRAITTPQDGGAARSARAGNSASTTNTRWILAATPMTLGLSAAQAQAAQIWGYVGLLSRGALKSARRTRRAALSAQA